MAATGTGNSLTGINAAASWGIDGSDQYTSTNTLDFSGFENLTGGTGVDTFNITAAHSGNLSGAGGADVFTVTGTTLTGNIFGGDGNDSVTLQTTAVVTGTVSGDDNRVAAQ